MKYPKKISSVFRLQFLIAGYLPVFILSFFIFFRVQHNIQNYVHKEISRTAHHASGLLETFFYRNAMTLKAFSKNMLFNSPDPSKKDILILLTQIRQFYRYFDTLTLYSSEGRIITSTDLTQSVNFQQFFKKQFFERKIPFVSDPFLHPVSKQYILIMGIKVFLTQNPEKFVVLTAQIPMKTIWHQIHTVQFGETGKIIILNSKLETLGGVHENLLFKPFTSELVSQQIVSRTDFNWSFEFKSDKNYVAGVSKTGDTKRLVNIPTWYILLLQDQKESYFMTNMIKKYLLLLVPLMLVLIYFFSRYSSNLILKPLSVFIKGTKKAAMGNLSFKTRIKTFEEIEELSFNFDQMIEKLHEAQSYLRKEIWDKIEAEKAILELNRNLEKKVEERTKELIESEKMFSCGLLSTGMAHDFNNLLNRIKMSIDIMHKLIEHDLHLNEFLTEITDAISEGQSLTGSLLAFAKKETMDLVKTSLFSTLKTFENKIRLSLKQNSISLNLSCPSDLYILSEPNYLQQILLNLYQNAKQAFENTSGNIIINVFEGTEHITMHFKDGGPGISFDIQNHIFEPFFSTKNISQSSGMGLGLALVKSLVERMNGTIQVQSEETEGTLFIITFPKIKEPIKNEC